jgi:hypothetical protein
MGVVQKSLDAETMEAQREEEDGEQGRRREQMAK